MTDLIVKLVYAGGLGRCCLESHILSIRMSMTRIVNVSKLLS
jgi:hypothetical protein